MGLGQIYEQGTRELPTTPVIDFGRVWRALLSGTDREQAFRAFEVATLLALRRALRNGTVWVDHSLAFRSRERLFIPADRWENAGSRMCQAITQAHCRRDNQMGSRVTRDHKRHHVRIHRQQNIHNDQRVASHSHDLDAQSPFECS